MTVTSTATNERELLGQLVTEHGIYSIASMLVDFVGELEDKATGEDKQRWAQCGQGFKRAKRYADQYWREK